MNKRYRLGEIEENVWNRWRNREGILNNVFD